jgi:ADP-heptose:LPS heptosyltransferase
LIIRNDKLGDFILSLPVFALTKTALPDCKLYALVPQYTRDIAAACPWIDGIILDPGEQSGIQGIKRLLPNIKQQRFDGVITLFSTARIGLAIFLAGIPQRFAPATKLAQVFYNHRLAQRRSKSEKPEYVYNLDLAKFFLRNFNISLPADPTPPFLRFDASEIESFRTAFCNKYELNPDNKIVFIHPGSGGSANNLSPAQYAELADELQAAHSHTITIVITAGPGELQKAQAVAKSVTKASCIVYESTHGLLHFAKQISWADIFIGGSTGPLHIAGALDVPTVGFYARRRSATPLRWQTLNSLERRLAFTPPRNAGESDMISVDVHQAAAEIARKFLN